MTALPSIGRQTVDPAEQPRTVRRLFVTVDDSPCPFGCTYCFAGFRQYERPPTLAEVLASPELLDDVDVIYPACDSDLFALPNAIAVLEETLRLGKSVSVSTKASLGQDAAEKLGELAAQAIHTGLVLKVGISFSTRTRVPALEPRTPSYGARLRSLARLAEANVPRAAVLRPLLVDVGAAEYAAILADVAPITDNVLVGEEWLEATEALRRQPGNVSSDREVVLETVNWLAGKPLWPKRHSAELMSAVLRACLKLGLSVHQSDAALMTHLLDTLGAFPSLPSSMRQT